MSKGARLGRYSEMDASGDGVIDSQEKGWPTRKATVRKGPRHGSVLGAGVFALLHVDGTKHSG